jgi:hypothetical protein
MIPADMSEVEGDITTRDASGMTALMGSTAAMITSCYWLKGGVSGRVSGYSEKGRHASRLRGA